MTAATTEATLAEPVSARAESKHGKPAHGKPWWQRQMLIAVALLAVYFACTLITSPDGYLSTDTGGKAATLDAMVERGDHRPDLGYWAETVDPDGSLYPMFATLDVDGQWVNVTSLSMLYLALPLYWLGGYTLSLLVPMLGGVATAWAAGRLARQLLVGGPPHTSDRVVAKVMWLVGLATPVAVYSLDLWEHTLGLALMMWGASWIVQLAESPRLIPAIGAGLAFGAAATMRQEALVYGFVAGMVVVGLAIKHRTRSGWLSPIAMALAASSMLLGGIALEVFAMGASLRTGRSAGTATSSGSDAMLRVHEAVVTLGSINSFELLPAITLAIALIGGFALITSRSGGAAVHRSMYRGLVIVGCVYVVLLAGMVADGLSFVSGMLLASPVAGVGLTSGWRRSSYRMVWSLAVVPLPLVWFFQYTGGAGPQWGGRYILLTGTLLAVIGMVELEASPRVIARGLPVLSVTITIIGVLWLGQRSNGFAAATAELADRPESVLVFADPHATREAGPVARHEHWFAAPTTERRLEAADALGALGTDSFGFVSYQEPFDPNDPSAMAGRVERLRILSSEFTDYEVVRTDAIELLPGVELEVISFVRR